MILSVLVLLKGNHGMFRPTYVDKKRIKTIGRMMMGIPPGQKAAVCVDRGGGIRRQDGMVFAAIATKVSSFECCLCWRYVRRHRCDSCVLSCLFTELGDGMPKTWLILDATYLCWRAFYSTGVLSHGDVPTGVIYGFLRDILTFQEDHGTDRIVFCFDRGQLLRKRDYPGYKANRTKQFNEESLQSAIQVKEQIRRLRTELLPQLGFVNVFSKSGYEADDIIASVCLNLPKKDEGIIVGADYDLYQLLTDRILMWHPTSKKATTAESFSKEYGITPTQWINVKAIAGCSSDNVIGIKGVGEKTAAKFLNGSLKPSSKAWQLISANNHVWDSNRHLVKLPYAGCPVFPLQRDQIDRREWNKVLDSMGMKSLKGKFL